MSKLTAQGRTEAVVRARRLGLIVLYKQRRAVECQSSREDYSIQSSQKEGQCV
jgi:hypothetical protein